MKSPQQHPFARNIDTNGRLFRAAGAAVFAVVAIVLWSKYAAVGVGFALASAFLAFEAARGWCALRACGLKTKF